MPAFAFHLIPEAGEPSMTIIDAPTIDAAKAQAVATIRGGTLRAIRLWDGERTIAIERPAAPKSAKPVDNDEDRGARMIAMKAEGKSHRQIADAFGISIERARQLMARTESRTKMMAIEPNRAGLSVRAQGVLRDLIDEPETDRAERDRRLPERIAALTRAQILDVPNAGHRTIAEFEAWLWDRDLYLNG